MLLDVLEEALATSLIEELPTSIGLYQFTHTLMQKALITELSLTRRVRLHAQIAQNEEAGQITVGSRSVERCVSDVDRERMIFSFEAEINMMLLRSLRTPTRFTDQK
jgi:hypothetical protein